MRGWTAAVLALMGVLAAPEARASMAVTCVQEQLAAAGFDPGAADGRAGARTRAAAAAFTAARGPETSRPLDADSAVIWCRRIGLADPALRAFWPRKGRPEVIFGDTIPPDLREAISSAVRRTDSVIPSRLDVDLAVPVRVIVAEGAAEFRRMVLAATDLPLADLSVTAKRQCSSLVGINGGYYPGLIALCLTPGARLGPTTDRDNRIFDQASVTFLVAHEMFHDVQYHLNGSFKNDTPRADRIAQEGPFWMLEGSADVFANAIALYPSAEVYEDWARALLTPEMRDLTRYDHRDPNRPSPWEVYEAGRVAVMDLQARAGFVAVIRFYDELGSGTPWEQAFEKVFRLRVSTFRTVFKAPQ